MLPQEYSCCQVFPGAIIECDDPRYDTLVRGFNQRFVGNPRYVHLCGTSEQVVQAVQHALDQKLRITVRGGGHCYENFVSDNKDGVIIDLSALNAVSADQTQTLFCVEGGCTLWNVYQQVCKQFGKVLPGGSCASVGAGGHIVGGGYGLLSRKHGLIVDYLHAVEVVIVTQDRRAQRIIVSRNAPSQDERDLFWAHQGGGGGNFGIVTKYWFSQLPDVPKQAYLWSIAWQWRDMTENKNAFLHLLHQYGDFFKQHSKPGDPYQDMFTLLHLTHESAGELVLTIQYVGDDPDSVQKDFIGPIAEPMGVTYGSQSQPVGEYVYVEGAKAPRCMSWLEATQTLNGTGPNRRGKYKSAYMIEPFSDPQIETIWKHLHEATYQYKNSQALLQVDSYGCQVNNVDHLATPVPQRSSIMKLQYQTYWTDPQEDNTHLRWIREFYKEMYGPGGPVPDGKVDGCFVNYPDVDLPNWQNLYYKDNYPRLQQVKKRWDPLNIFHHAQSIKGA